MLIRFAKENELIQVNELRKQVNDLHTLERGGSRMVLFLHTVQYGTAEARDRAVRFAQRGWNKRRCSRF